MNRRQLLGSIAALAATPAYSATGRQTVLIDPPAPGTFSNPIPTLVAPKTGWNGTTGSGFLSAAPTASAIPHGSSLSAYQTTGAISWQQSLEIVADDLHEGVIHGGVGADPVNGRLDYVQVYLENDTPVTISALSWSTYANCFGYRISIRANDKCGIAQGYIRFVPVNGLERVLPFTVWINKSGVSGYVDRTSATMAGYVDPATGVDDTSHGTLASPWATVAYGLTRMQGAREGGILYCAALTEAYITTTPPTAPTITYPCTVKPKAGVTKAQVVISRATGRGQINIQCQKVIFDGITFDCSKITDITGAFVGACYFRNCDLVDSNWSTGFYGAYDTWGGTSFPQYYNGVTGTETANRFIVAGNATRYTGLIDCTVAMDAITGFRQYVNIRGPDGGSARFAWDCIFHDVISTTDLASLMVFNYHAKQEFPHRARLHTATEVTVSAVSAYSGGKTTITFSGTPLQAATQDCAMIVLEGAFKGDTDPSPSATGGSGTTYYFTTTSTITLPRDYSTMVVGTRCRVYATGHADAFQTAFTSSVMTRRDGFDNLYFQNYLASGLTIQGMLIQSNNGTTPTTPLPTGSFTTTNGSAVVSVAHTAHGYTTGNTGTIASSTAVGGIIAGNLNGNRTVTVVDANTWTFVADAAATSGATGGGSPTINPTTWTSVGTTLTPSLPITLNAGDAIHVSTSQNYATIAVDRTNTSTHTLVAAFTAGDISGATCLVGKGQRNTLMVNCILEKTVVDGAVMQVQNAILSFGQLCCDFLGVDTGNNTYQIRPRQAGFGMNGWAAYGCIFGAMGVDTTAPVSTLPTAQMIADRNHFINGSPVPVGTNSNVGTITVNEAGGYVSPSAVPTCGAAIIRAAPWDMNGRRRTARSLIGAVIAA